MDNAFDDINRELINHLSDNKGRTFAKSFEEFISKIVSAINQALVESPGRETILEPALASALRDNLSPEEWKAKYVSILKTMFFLTLSECHQLKSEFARHTYDMLRR